jgi:hypothetical protein
MDDIKLNAVTNSQLQGLLQLTQTFSRDIKMSFEIEKCKTLSTAKGKLEMISFMTENENTMEAMNEDDTYKYLGHMQTKQMKHTQMKQKLGDEYLNRTKSISKTKLNGKNTMKAINTYVTPSIYRWLQNSKVVAYRPGEPPNQKENVTHKVQISPSLCRKGKTNSTTAYGWKRDDQYNSAAR